MLEVILRALEQESWIRLLPRGGNGGNTDEGGRLSTVDLLIKVAHFVTKVNNIFHLRRS